MGGINPNIALSYQPPQIQVQTPQPLQQFGQILSLQNLMQQRQLLPIEMQTRQLQLDQLRRVTQEQLDYAAWLKSQLEPSTAQGTTAAPLPVLTGQAPAVSAGPALVGQTPTVAPLAGGASPTMADLMNLPTVDRGSQMAALTGMPMPATQPAAAPTQNLVWPTQQATPALAVPAPAVPAPVVASPTAAGAMPGLNIGEILTRFPNIGPGVAKNYLETLKDQQDLEIKQHDNNAKRMGELAGIGISIRDSKDPASAFAPAIYKAIEDKVLPYDVGRQLIADGYDKHANDVQRFIDQAQTAQTQSEIAKNSLAMDLDSQKKAAKDIRFVNNQDDYNNFLAGLRPNVRSQLPATFSPQVKDVIQGLETPAAELPKVQVSQRETAAGRLAAAISRSPDEFNTALQNESPDVQAVFAGAKTPLEVMQRAQNPDQYVTAQHANLQTLLEAERVQLDRQKYDQEYGQNSAQSWAAQIYAHPDLAKEVPPNMRTAVINAFSNTYRDSQGRPLAFPIQLDGASLQQETAAKNTLDDVQWIRNALKNPNIANNVGPILGRLQNLEQATGEATGLTGADAQQAQEFRTRIRMLLANEAGTMHARMNPKILDDLQKSSGNITMDPKMLQGAIDGVEGYANNKITGFERQRFGGQTRLPEARGIPSNTVRMKAPDGTVRDIPSDQVDHYKSLGAAVVQ